MKKLVLIFSILFMLTSCGKSDEEKLNELIAEAAKSTLFIPESYDPVSLQCDSMSINVINEENIKKASRIIELGEKANSIQRSIESDMQQRDFWRGKSSDYYREYANKVEKNVSQRMKWESEMSNLLTELQREYWDKKENGEFCGYLVAHRFRAKNNVGTVGFCDMIFLLNKDKTEVLSAYNVNDENFQNFMKVIDTIIELGPENISEDNINLEETVNEINSLFEN